MSRSVRVANCSGFYGDRRTAAAEVVHGGPIDVLTGDWLAELTMGILAMDQLRDPDLGYARTFTPAIAPVLPVLAERGIRVVANAGGLNPGALARELEAAISAAGLTLRVAVVTGDDLRPWVVDQLAAGEPLHHADTGDPLDPSTHTPLTANAYLGCWAIAAALEAGADIVVTGRVTDAAVVVGAAAWWHGWRPDDWDPLAGALAAAHVIECGTQATGGNHPFWEDIDLVDVGFPIAEIAADGSAVITKHPGTGGRVDRHSVTAQLVYEVGGPAYLSPDVIAHLDTLRLEELGEDRVRLSGVVGSPPPPTLKLGITASHGHRNRMTAVIGGHDGAAKAARLIDLAWRRLGGQASFDEARADVYARAPGTPVTLADDLTLVDFVVRDRDPKRVGTRFTAPLIELALATVPGLTFATGPGRPKPVAVFWPVLVDRALASPAFTLDGETTEVPHPPTGPRRHEAGPLQAPPPGEAGADGLLGRWVGARSGDKGGHANVGLWVRDPAHHAWLRRTITVERVQHWLAGTGFTGDVTLHELPALHAINVVLEGFLGLGVASNLAPDPQAKCLGEFFRSQTVPGPTR
jgi:hypothetical protein